MGKWTWHRLKKRILLWTISSISFERYTFTSFTPDSDDGLPPRAVLQCMSLQLVDDGRIFIRWVTGLGMWHILCRPVNETKGNRNGSGRLTREYVNNTKAHYRIPKKYGWHCYGCVVNNRMGLDMPQLNLSRLVVQFLTVMYIHACFIWF